MYVKDHMTKNPVTVTPDTSVSKVLELMQKGHFHRVPVVDENGVLKGLITEGVVTEASGQNTTSLSIFELNYLLSRTTVKEIMIKDVKTITEGEFVEVAAEVMLEAGINVLPVVDDSNKVIGIITEKDIFKTFVDLLGLKHQGTKFVIKMENKPGLLAKVSSLLAENDANVEATGVYQNEERGAEFFVKATGTIEVEAMTKILKENGMDVVAVVQTTTEGKTVHYEPEKIA
jgi:acetoin utilization protein AcuB